MTSKADDALEEWWNAIDPHVQAWATQMFFDGQVVSDDLIEQFMRELPDELRPSREVFGLLVEEFVERQYARRQALRRRRGGHL